MIALALASWRPDALVRISAAYLSAPYRERYRCEPSLESGGDALLQAGRPALVRASLGRPGPVRAVKPRQFGGDPGLDLGRSGSAPVVARAQFEWRPGVLCRAVVGGGRPQWWARWWRWWRPRPTRPFRSRAIRRPPRRRPVWRPEDVTCRMDGDLPERDRSLRSLPPHSPGGMFEL